MKKLALLKVAFDTTIQPYEVSAFRGAIIDKVGRQHEWFHNHDNTSTRDASSKRQLATDASVHGYCRTRNP